MSLSGKRGRVPFHDLFVAGFIGSPAMNFMPVTLQAQHGIWQLETSTGSMQLTELPPELHAYYGKAMIFGFRPEEAEMLQQAHGTPVPNGIPGIIDDVEPIGNLVLYYITVGDKVYVVSREAEKEAFDKHNLLGKSVLIAFEAEKRGQEPFTPREGWRQSRKRSLVINEPGN